MKIISTTLLAAALAVVTVSADMENVKTLTVTATPQSFHNPANPASVSRFGSPDAPLAAPFFYEAPPTIPTPLSPTEPNNPNVITVVANIGCITPNCVPTTPQFSNPPSTEPISPTSPSDVLIVMPTTLSQGNPGPLDITVVACDGSGELKCASFSSYSKLPAMQPISPISPAGNYPPVTPTPFPDPKRDDIHTKTVVALGPCGKIECPTPQNPGCSDSPMLTSQMLSLDASIDQGVNAPTSDPHTNARRL